MLQRLILILPLLFLWNCNYPEPDDLIPPTVVLIYPYDGAVIDENTMIIRAEASDDDQVNKIWIFLNGEIIKESPGSSIAHPLDLSNMRDNRVHVVQAAAEDDGDNTGYSAQITFTITTDTSTTAR